jgi:hypothetical protein
MAVPTNVRGLLRQGDVLLVPVERLPEDLAVTASGARLVLAEGEATGHAHAVVSDSAELVETPDGTLYLVVASESPAALVHEEHEPIPLTPGAYEVKRQREYAPRPESGTSFRWVAD